MRRQRGPDVGHVFDTPVINERDIYIIEQASPERRTTFMPNAIVVQSHPFNERIINTVDHNSNNNV
jgi:hypothetical protein